MFFEICWFVLRSNLDQTQSFRLLSFLYFGQTPISDPSSLIIGGIQRLIFCEDFFLILKKNEGE